MSAISAALREQICAAMARYISSRESVDGRTLSNSQSGPNPCPSGLDHVPVNPTPQPESISETLTPATSGPKCTDFSVSVNLSSALASKLKALLSTDGSIEYRQTWKQKATPSGRQYWAHTASAHPTSGNACIGWHTPNTDDRESKNKGRNLGATVAAVVGWPIPMAGNPGTETYNEAGNTDSGRKTVALVGFNTPRATDGENGGPNQSGGALSADAATFGATPSPSSVPTGKRGVLNPAFSLWLMGFPAVWHSCGERAMRSVRKRPRSSSAHIAK